MVCTAILATLFVISKLLEGPKSKYFTQSVPLETPRAESTSINSEVPA